MRSRTFLVLFVAAAITHCVASLSVLNFSKWKTVLMIGAHPDDIEGCVGGLVYTLTQHNISVFYVIVTNGDKGCGNAFCEHWGPEQIAYQRTIEAVDAAAVLGVPAANVFLLDYEDCMLTSYPEQQVRQDLVYYIRSIKPDALFSWFPQPNYNILPSQGWGDLGYHPDHQATGRLVLDAQFDAGVGRLFPTAGASWSGFEYYQWAFWTPVTHYLPLSETVLKAKINAFLAHKTQYQNATQIADYVTFWSQQSGRLVGQLNAEAFMGYF